MNHLQSTEESTHSGWPKLAATAVVITKNEELSIAACLQSLSALDEVLVVDNGSSDATLSIAANFTNVKIVETEWLGYGATRQRGVEQARNDWILWIDADERLSAGLTKELHAILSVASSQTVVALRRKNHFLGQPIFGCGWSPDWVTRLFHRQHASFDLKQVHEGLTGYKPHDVTKAREPLIHFSYSTARQFFEKNIKYAFLAAEERKRQHRQVRFWQLPVRPVWEFFRNYVLRRGIFDGRAGFIICFGSAMYVFTRDVLCYLDSRQANSATSAPHSMNGHSPEPH